MAAEEHVGDSSSQRDNHITHIRCKNKLKSIIYLSDDTSFDVINEIILKEHIYEGKEISLSEIEHLKNASIILEAERCAFSILSNGMESQYTLGLKLQKKRFDKEIIEKTVTRLKEEKYLNDREYARAWVSSRIQTHPEGKKAFLAGLLKKGINYDDAKSVIDSMITDEIEIEMIKVLVEKLIDHAKSHDKIAKLLISRGFRYNIVRNILKEIF